MFFLKYQFADSNGNLFSNPNTTSHQYFAELWNGTAQVSGFTFGSRILNAFTIMFYPSNVATSTINSGILTGLYTIRIVDLNKTDIANPIYSNLTGSIFFITKLSNPNLTALTILYPK
jgi:hypothetical protein